ncbi:protein of unknown function [Candidatus Filomicrobium marinum]|uniref:Uncharacterized protein n=1 Tax=Candidatus Filomicrobium marinum TaxID=1608628 RepID=A0A0D6JAU3_9HYPH|nr:protein of unknown function [Candidatus Filomicrobium marinum]
MLLCELSEMTFKRHRDPPFEVSGMVIVTDR